MKKRILAILICYILLIISVIGIITVFNTNEENRSNKIQIIATIFPDYDFVKRIGGEYVEVKLLLDSGVDSHNYEPSVRNMKNISDSDIFIYTGMSSEPWAKEIIDSFITSQPSRILETFINLSDNQLLMHLWVTCEETIIGFSLGVVIGVLIAIILWWSDFLSKVSEPFLVVLNSLPKVALRTSNNNLGWSRYLSNYCNGTCNIINCNNT